MAPLLHPDHRALVPDGSGSHGAGPRAAPGAPNARPERSTRCHGSTPRTTSGTTTVEISLISAVRTHALCVHTQDCLGGRHRRAGRRGTAAHRPRLAAHALHTHAYAGLIRPREKAPRNSNLRQDSQREHAGHSVVHTQKRARNQTNWWRGFRTIERPSGYRPDEGAGRPVVPMHCIGSCPTHLNSFGRPRPEKLVLPEFPPLAFSPITAPGSSPPG